jgi:hypothetical protein
MLKLPENKGWVKLRLGGDLNKTVSQAKANSEYRMLLTNVQEKALIARINCLTNYNMPPTSAIVRNIAEEIRDVEVNKN